LLCAWLLFFLDSYLLTLRVQELEQIELVWLMTSEWEDHWNVWKSGRFIDVETGDMEEISTTLFRKLQKMSRELKVSFAPCRTQQR